MGWSGIETVAPTPKAQLLRSSMGYIGAKKLEDIKKNAKFIKITKAGFYESMVHSVEMMEPTLNFRL